MEQLLEGKVSASLVGLCQALGVGVYTAIIAAFLYLVGQSGLQPGYWGVVVMLVLLVLSAAITGSLVFGLAAYHALRGRTRLGFEIFAYTILYIFVFVSLVLMSLFFFAV